jgi:hypothetical protein
MDLLDILFPSLHGLARYHRYIISWTARYPLCIISLTCSISSLHHFMDLLEILFTSFHELARYPLYIISWTYYISSLHHVMDLLDRCKEDIEQSMKWCNDDIEQVHAMMERGYRASPWPCSISSLHHFMDLLHILFTSCHGFARYPLYIISWTCSISSLHHFMDLLSMKWCKEDIEQVHEMM